MCVLYMSEVYFIQLVLPTRTSSRYFAELTQQCGVTVLYGNASQDL